MFCKLIVYSIISFSFRIEETGNIFCTRKVNLGFASAKCCLSSNCCVSKRRWKLCILVFDYYKKLINIQSYNFAGKKLRFLVSNKNALFLQQKEKLSPPVLFTPFLNLFRLFLNKRTKP